MSAALWRYFSLWGLERKFRGWEGVLEVEELDEDEIWEPPEKLRFEDFGVGFLILRRLFSDERRAKGYNWVITILVLIFWDLLLFLSILKIFNFHDAFLLLRLSFHLRFIILKNDFLSSKKSPPENTI